MSLSDTRFATTCGDGHMQVPTVGTSCIPHLTTWYPRSSWPSVPIIPSIPSKFKTFSIFHNSAHRTFLGPRCGICRSRMAQDIQLPMILTNRVGRRGLLTKLGKGSGKVITHTETGVSIVDPDNIFIKVVRVCACASVRVRACVRARVCVCVGGVEFPLSKLIRNNPILARIQTIRQGYRDDRRR